MDMRMQHTCIYCTSKISYLDTGYLARSSSKLDFLFLRSVNLSTTSLVTLGSYPEEGKSRDARGSRSASFAPRRRSVHCDNRRADPPPRFPILLYLPFSFPASNAFVFSFAWPFSSPLRSFAVLLPFRSFFLPHFHPKPTTAITDSLAPCTPASYRELQSKQIGFHCTQPLRP